MAIWIWIGSVLKKSADIRPRELMALIQAEESPSYKTSSSSPSLFLYLQHPYFPLRSNTNATSKVSPDSRYAILITTWYLLP